MLVLSDSALSMAPPFRLALIHSIDSGSSTTKAVPISVPMIEPVPPMMTMARNKIERSIIFLAMVIIGGTGSIMGTLMGTAFVVLLPESMEWISAGLKGTAIDKALSLNTNITFLREIAIGVIIIAFLMFEPDGLAHRWRQIKTYWKLYPFSH